MKMTDESDVKIIFRVTVPKTSEDILIKKDLVACEMKIV